MILISHRGNTTGPAPATENSPDYIAKALQSGYNVEIDVWRVGKKWFLGHDTPQYEVNCSYLNNKNLWCHAKNIDALTEMLSMGVHCFWHQEDKYTLTSKGYVWAYPSKHNSNISSCIDVLPENIFDINCYSPDTAGVCSDFIEIIGNNNNA